MKDRHSLYYFKGNVYKNRDTSAAKNARIIRTKNAILWLGHGQLNLRSKLAKSLESHKNSSEPSSKPASMFALMFAGSNNAVQSESDRVRLSIHPTRAFRVPSVTTLEALTREEGSKNKLFIR